MAKIYCSNNQYNGISAGINFANGVGVTNDPHLIAWFNENGYTIVNDPREPGIYDPLNYKELIELAKERGFNAIGLKKEQLIQDLMALDAKDITDNGGIIDAGNNEVASWPR
jgi:hypothetical protein